MAKRTGLGRGIGSLIPVQDNPSQARPVDVFFPYNEVPHAEGTAGASPVAGSTQAAPAETLAKGVVRSIEREAIPLAGGSTSVMNAGPNLDHAALMNSGVAMGTGGGPTGQMPGATSVPGHSGTSNYTPSPAPTQPAPPQQ